jgi:hypothetical protein
VAVEGLAVDPTSGRIGHDLGSVFFELLDHLIDLF